MVGGTERAGGWRLRLADAGPPFGLVVALLLVGGLFGLALLIFDPFAPGEPATGVVKAFGLRETEVGSGLVAVVTLPDGGATTVVIPQPTRCAVGRAIHLTKRRRPWGASFKATPQPCPEAQARAGLPDR